MLKIYSHNEGRNSLVFGQSKEICESLRKMRYNQKIKYYIKNDKSITEKLKKISIGKLISIIGYDYLVIRPQKIYFHKSIEKTN